MSYSDIETAFLDKCAAISGVNHTQSPEPAIIDTLPAVTLYFVGCPQEPDATGGWYLVTYAWQVGVTVALEDIADAQTELKSLLPAIMATVRSDPTLGGACHWATLEDREEPPVRLTDEQGFRKNLYLRAQTTES